MDNKLDDILKNVREPFVSEADLQFYLAWELQKSLPDAQIILEYPAKEYLDEKSYKQKYYDIAVKDKNGISFIELKYKTKKQEITRHEQKLCLKQQGARDIGNYLFLKDVSRMENTGVKNNKVNYCIMMTNDFGYCNSRNQETLDSNFKLIGEKIGTLPWKYTDSAVQHWTGKYPAIELKGYYNCAWQDLQIQGIPFKYLILKVQNTRE